MRVFNNIMIAEEGRAVLRLAPEAVGQNNTLDHNLYFSPTGFRAVWGEREFGDFEAFRQATRQESRGQFAPPRLRAAGRGGRGRLPLEAYRLMSDSPCRDAGTEYRPEYGAADYWGFPLHPLHRLNIGPDQSR